MQLGALFLIGGKAFRDQFLLLSQPTGLLLAQPGTASVANIDTTDARHKLR